MTIPGPIPTERPRRVPRWLPILAVALAMGLLILLAALLARQLRPQPDVWLRIAPAASTVDEATAIDLSSGGWRRNETVAVCLNRPDERACDPESAALVENADERGNLNTSLLAGSQLAAGRTTVVTLGLESGRQASRSFRVLRASDSLVVATQATGSPAGDDGGRLTPIAGAQPTTLPEAGGGWAGEYFANPDLAGPPAVTRDERELAFDWGLGAPDPALPPDGFSARWVRRLAFPGMNHRFQLQADGGVRLYVDDTLLIDQWQDDGFVVTHSVSIDLTAGEHTVRVEYVDALGNASFALRWEAIDLFPDWRGEYFTNPDLAGRPALVRNDPDPNWDWGDDGPAPGIIPADGFSARWTRSLAFAPGVYRFVLTAEDGGRLLVEGQAVIDAWQGSDGQTITVDRELSGGQYQIVVEFRNLAGPARIAIGWSPLTDPGPMQVAAIDPAPAPGVAPAPSTPSPAPGEPSPATPTPDSSLPPTATPTSDPFTPQPGATETPLPTSSVTASPTETSATPNGTASPGAATPTPTATATASPMNPPNAVRRVIEINPTVGVPGQVINITSGNWSPGTVLRVALGQFGQPYTQAVALPGVSFTTPSDSSQSFTFSIVFPSEPPWSTQILPVQVWVHNAGWTEWGRDEFEIDRP